MSICISRAVEFQLEGGLDSSGGRSGFVQTAVEILPEVRQTISTECVGV